MPTPVDRSKQLSYYVKMMVGVITYELDCLKGEAYIAGDASKTDSYLFVCATIDRIVGTLQTMRTNVMLLERVAKDKGAQK